MIDTELYRVFYVVAQQGTVSAAAQQLYVTQPAVSKSIKKLESLTGCILFSRSSKGVKLTTEGEMLFDYVQKGFAHLQSGERVLDRIRTMGEGLIKVGISNTLCKFLFIPHVTQFHQHFPGIRFNIINRTSPETLELLRAGKIDFAIVSLPEDRKQLQCYELLTIQDVLVAGKDFYPELQSPKSLETLADYPLITLEQDNVSRRYVESFFIKHGCSLKPEIEISSLDFLLEFVQIGLGVGVGIRNFMEQQLQQGTIREIAVSPSIPIREVGVVVLKGMVLSTAARTFIESLAVYHGKEHSLT